MSRTRIAILGASGMVGRAVLDHFASKPEYHVFASFRSDRHVVPSGIEKLMIDAQRVDLTTSLQLDVDYVINCIGLIPQRFGMDSFQKYTHASLDSDPYYMINTIFPLKLSTILHGKALVIHVSTDCVFSGQKSTSYVETDKPDCVEHYGMSKFLGEPKDCLVVRTSVIGKESGTNHSLLEWARSKKDLPVGRKNVNGYTNYLWNGVTCDELARTFDTIIKEGLYRYGVRHVFSNCVSKYDLLHMLNEKFDIGLNITPIEYQHSINRTLGTLYNFNEKLNVPTIREMIDRMTP